MFEQYTPSELFEEEIKRLKRIHDPGWRIIWDHVQDLKRLHIERTKELNAQLKKKSQVVAEVRETTRHQDKALHEKLGVLTDRIIDLERKESLARSQAEDWKSKYLSAQDTTRVKDSEIETLSMNIVSLERAIERKGKPDKMLQKRLNDSQEYIKK